LIPVAPFSTHVLTGFYIGVLYCIIYFLVLSRSHDFLLRFCNKVSSPPYKSDPVNVGCLYTKLEIPEDVCLGQKHVADF
jgi:hypothetical protein